jgi:hypothetical protein
MLTTLNVRLFADGHLAVKADSRPTTRLFDLRGHRRFPS